MTSQPNQKEPQVHRRPIPKSEKMIIHDDDFEKIMEPTGWRIA